MSSTEEIKQQQKNKRGIVRDSVTGAVLTAALPAATHLRYEIFDRLGHVRRIKQLVEQARLEGKLFAASPFEQLAGRGNSLQARMRLGDTILQSHAGDNFRQMLKAKQMDLTTLSLGGSGGAFPHVAVSTELGRAIDPGRADLKTFKSELLELLAKPSKFSLSKYRALRKYDFTKAVKGELSSFLAANTTDAFESASSRPNASVVLRHANAKNIDPSVLARAIAKTKEVGYSKEDALLAGLKRLIFPFDPARRRGNAPNLSGGTFCSHGVCSVQSAMGAAVPDAKITLPPDLLRTKNQELVGIGVNSRALETYDKVLKGLRGQDRLAGAAKLTMLDTLRQAANARRGFAGVLVGATGLAGGLGGLLYNKLGPGNK